MEEHKDIVMAKETQGCRQEYEEANRLRKATIS
jgi:hypothetical protein